MKFGEKPGYQHTDPVIYLIGPSGVGKSTVGRILAQIMRLQFVDLDNEIEKHAGKTSVEIFDEVGESGFRELETESLLRFADSNCMVVSTGGGTIVREENRKILRSGTVVYLYATPQLLEQRTRRSKHRPLLNKGDPKETIARLMKEREPLYREEADIIIYADHTSAKAAAKQIERKLLAQ